MVDMISYIEQEKARIDRNLQGIQYGRIPETPGPPPIPGVKVQLPDIQHELDKIPKPEEFIPRPNPNDPIANRLYRILVGAQHGSLSDAAMADLVDVIPFVGDISNMVRVADSFLKGKEPLPPETIRQGGDLILGADIIAEAVTSLSGLPGLGTAVTTTLDFLTPTNIINYLERTRGPMQKPSIDFMPPTPIQVLDFIDENTKSIIPRGGGW